MRRRKQLCTELRGSGCRGGDTRGKLTGCLQISCLFQDNQTCLQVSECSGCPGLSPCLSFPICEMLVELFIPSVSARDLWRRLFHLISSESSSVSDLPTQLMSESFVTPIASPTAVDFLWKQAAGSVWAFREGIFVWLEESQGDGSEIFQILTVLPQ